MMDSRKKRNDVWLLLRYHVTDNREKCPANEKKSVCKKRPQSVSERVEKCVCSHFSGKSLKHTDAVAIKPIPSRGRPLPSNRVQMFNEKKAFTWRNDVLCACTAPCQRCIIQSNLWILFHFYVFIAFDFSIPWLFTTSSSYTWHFSLFARPPCDPFRCTRATLHRRIDIRRHSPKSIQQALEHTQKLLAMNFYCHPPT